MVELHRRFPLDDVARPGAEPAGATPALTLTVRNGVAHALVLARRGRTGDVAAALGIAQAPGQVTVTETFVACPTAPGQWAVTADWGDDGALARSLRARVGAAGDVSEQSHGRQTIRLGGAAVRELLTRLCALDLHPRVAAPGFCAPTPVAGIAALIRQLDAAPTFDVVVYAGYAEAFWGRLTTSAASFGYLVAVERVG